MSVAAFAGVVIATAAKLIGVSEEEQQNLKKSVEAAIAGGSGTDPADFLPELRSVVDTDRSPRHVAQAWVQLFVKEFSGIAIKRQACAKEDPGPDDDVIPVKEVCKCTLDVHRLIDKLK